MLTRLTHAAIAFAVTAVLYQTYAVTVVPLVEPPAAAEMPFDPSTLLVATGRADLSLKHKALLASYFAADHWCFAPTVRIVENGEVTILLDRYEETDSGQVTIPQFAAIYFPHGRHPGGAPPTDAVIMESSAGATLQLDRQVGQMVGFGKIQFGQLKGDVVIRSDMDQPGPQDDLRIVTKDIYMNEERILTPEAVEMRWGDHLAHGRELEIHFLPAESARHDAAGNLYGKLESLEIKRDVNVTIAPGNLNGLGGGSTAGESASAPTIDAPIRIRSAGPFSIDFGNYLAKFSDQVEVRQLHADGKLDELRAPDKLELFFHPTASAADSATRSTKPNLEPATAAAHGTAEAPVTASLLSQNAAAVCEHMQYEIQPRRATLWGTDEVTLTYAGGEVHARTVQYELPPEGSKSRLGTLYVRGGAGRMKAALDPARSDETFEVDWKKELQLVRRDGQPVLILEGRPHLNMSGRGELWADSLELFLREKQPEEVDSAQAAKVNALPAEVVPQRLTASGRVSIDSAELTAKINELDLRFNFPLEQPVGGGSPPGALPSGAPAAASPASPVRDRSTAAQPWNNLSRTGPRRSYDVSGVTLKVSCNIRNRRPEVSAIRVDGGVVFQEKSPELAAEPPLKITAERLRATKIDTPAMELEIVGAAADGALAAQPAEIATRTALLRAPAVRVNRGTGSALVDSAGELRLLVDRDLSGQPTADPQPLHVTWQKSMTLVDRRVTFLGDVTAQHPAGWLRTQKLVAQFTAALALAEPNGAKPELEQLECWQGAVAEFDQSDAAGKTSHQHLELQSLSANQKTGAISGQGPGVIDSVHVAHGSASLFGGGGSPLGGATPPSALAEDGGPVLRNLHIDFSRAVSGNLLQRRVQVEGDVRTVYGTVADWTERLTISPGAAPGPDVLQIQCEVLAVAESPLARVQQAPGATRGLGPVELRAEHNVEVEGEHPKEGPFVVRGGLVTFDQMKRVLSIKGEGAVPAKLLRQARPGQPPDEMTMKEFDYYLDRPNGTLLEVKGFQGGSFSWETLDAGRKESGKTTK